MTTDRDRESKRRSDARRYAANPEYFREKVRRSAAKLFATNPELFRVRKRTVELKHRYGISLTEYDAMLEAQGGRCAICGTDKPGGKERWCVDHCKKTGRVRGLLCNCCNPGLGFFKHDIALLQRAIDYLKAHKR